MKNKFHKIIIKIICVFFIIFFYACAFYPPVVQKNGKNFGWPGGVFNGDWEDYYRCALSFIDGELYSDAINSLNKAIKQRDHDKRMARTYGMHFFDYFPHREKGVCYYYLDEFLTAKKELDYSLKYEKSAKAFYYLDLIQKRMMEKQNQKIGQPLISLNIANEVWSKADPIIISGIVTDNQLVHQVAINQKEVFIESAKQVIEFQIPVFLSQGIHTIDIKASNLLNGSSIKQIIVHADKDGPVIHINKISDISIQGILIDDSKIQSLQVNHKEHFIHNECEVHFHISLDQEKLPITLIATDSLGNQTFGFWDQNTLKSYCQTLIAQNHYFLSDADPLITINPLLPDIQLYGWSDQTVVFIEYVNIEGQTSSESGISQITINNTLIPIKSGPLVIFSPSIQLSYGDNDITIEVKDHNGHTNAKTITIHRKIPEVYKASYRLNLKVSPFDYPHNQNPKTFFQQQLIQNFIDSQRFSLYLNALPDAMIKNIKQKSQETYFEQNNHTTPEIMLLGYIYQSTQGSEIVARIIDINKGKIIAINDVYYERYDNLSEIKIAQQLVDKILNDIPRMEGSLALINNEFFIMPKKWQPKKGQIFTEWPLTIFCDQPSIINPITKQILGANSQILGFGYILSENLDGSYKLDFKQNQLLSLNNDLIKRKAITK